MLDFGIVTSGFVPPACCPLACEQIKESWSRAGERSARIGCHSFANTLGRRAIEKLNAASTARPRLRLSTTEVPRGDQGETGATIWMRLAPGVG
jgi:hypothetical protein